MVFFIIVGVVLAAVLVWAWRFDRIHGKSRIKPPENDPAVGEAKAMRYNRNVQGLGGGGR